MLSVRQAGSALFRLSLQLPAIGEDMERYGVGGRMSCEQWLQFVRSEQVDAEGGDEEVGACERRFTGLTDDREGALEAVGPLQLALLLLCPENDAVGPPREHDLSAPLAHYWGSCSHNSYIVGDQLTGESRADCYRRNHTVIHKVITL